MRTVILGKIVNNVYYINDYKKKIIDKSGEEKIVFTAKPRIRNRQEVKEWREICSYKGQPRYNSNSYGSKKCLNISETETVTIDNEIFRADLNEMHLHANKVLEEIDVNKEALEMEFDALIKDFNSTMIDSNDKLKAYCDVHKLSYEDTDCIELFAIVFSNYDYEIVDGVMKTKEKYYNDYIAVANCNHSVDCAISGTSSRVYSTLTASDGCLATTYDY